MIGDWSGGGIGDMIDKVTLRDCAEICDSEILCKAFQHSKKHNQCKLVPNPNPINPIQWGDFIFCQREGTKSLLKC